MIEPYYHDDRAGITIIHGDCRDVLPGLERGAVDAVITDPPYGISYENKRGDIAPHKTYSAMIQGDATDVGQQVIDQCFASGWPVCAFAHHRFPWRGDWRQMLVWDKGGAVGGGGDIATCWKFTWELIQVGGFGKLNGSRDSSVLRYGVMRNDMPFHPTQKPLSLLQYLVAKLTADGAMILDPFMGSGTTLHAAKNLGRKAIGIEIEEKFCEAAVNRLRQEVLF